MPPSIEQRCQRRDTHGFVVPETVDLLAEKVVGVIGDRRISLMHRYLGERAGTPRLFTGYRLWHGGMSDAVTHTPGRGLCVYLRGAGNRSQSVAFSIGPDETEQQARERYNETDDRSAWERREITFVRVKGSPGEPSVDDQIRVEKWDENGLGHETIVVFDDLDPVQEVAWDVKDDPLREVQIWDEYCDTHGMHFEHPDHERSGCAGRQSTRAEDLEVLAYLARRQEQTRQEQTLQQQALMEQSLMKESQ